MFKPDLYRRPGMPPYSPPGSFTPKSGTTPEGDTNSRQSTPPPPVFIKALLIIVFVKEEKQKPDKEMCHSSSRSKGGGERKRWGRRRERERERNRRSKESSLHPLCFSCFRTSKGVEEQSGFGVSCAFWQLDSADRLKSCEWQGSRPFFRASHDSFFLFFIPKEQNGRQTVLKIISNGDLQPGIH